MSRPALMFLLLPLLALLAMQFPLVLSDCPLDLSAANFTLAAATCSAEGDRGKCCRYINAFISVSIARYANATGNLGVPLNQSKNCLDSISQTMKLQGVPPNATTFCGFGTKIPVNYNCKGWTTISQMLESPKFGDVMQNCQVPLSAESNCRKCLNVGIGYIHRLVGSDDNITLNTCRDATFAALASQVDETSAVGIASCFFQVEGLNILPGPSPSSPSVLTPEVSPTPHFAASPSRDVFGAFLNKTHHSFHLSLVQGVGITITAVAVVILIFLLVIIRRKNRELEECGDLDDTSFKPYPLWFSRKTQEGPTSMFRRFSYTEIKRATDNFTTVIGQGGFGTVYKAQCSDGFVAAVKRINNVTEQGKDEFRKEMELLARLHHRHLVALRGFCVRKHERFLIYEYMENGSLMDHLHSESKAPLSWQSRIQIAIDVANALEYLHFYCNPPLCHRDIKSSNILLGENFVAKVADFGLAHASKDGSACFEPVNTNIRGTPGYMDPEYVVTQELTDKSDVYSYGVLMLEIITARRVIQDNKNLVEWFQTFIESDSVLPDLVDPRIRDSFDREQLHTVVAIIRQCTQREGRFRPSIKQVLRLLYESTDPTYGEFVEAVEDEEYEGNGKKGRPHKWKMQNSDGTFHSGDARFPSSSSTSRSTCSRSFLLETNSPKSSPNILSL